MTWIVALLVLASPAEAGRKKKQAKAEPPAAAGVALPCDWPVGTTFDFRYTHARTDTRQPALEGSLMTSPLQVRVTRAGDPMHVAYDAGEFTFEGTPEAVAALEAMTGGTDMPDLALEVVVTGGSVSGLANHSEIVDALEPMMREMTEGQPPELFAQTMAMFRDPALGPAMLLKEPTMFFALHCVTLQQGQVLAMPTAYPNPFGGEPIPGKSSVAMTGHDAAAGTASYETRDATDPEAAKVILKAALQRLAPEAMDPAMVETALAQLPPIETVSTGRMVYSTADGFPLSIEVSTVIGAEGHPMRRTDTWTWTRTAR